MSATALALRRWSRLRVVDRNHRSGRIESLRFAWGELSRRGGLGYGAITDGEPPFVFIHTPLGSLYIHTSATTARAWHRWRLEWAEHGLRYGTHGLWWWPWEWDWQSTELLDFDRHVVAVERKGRPKFYVFGDEGSWDRHRALIASVSQIFPYRYLLRGGEVQERQATVHVERRTWRRRCLPFLRRQATSIEVKFDDEVGERTGSWKGGVVGCGQELWFGETPAECLRRMERTRRFE